MSAKREGRTQTSLCMARRQYKHSARPLAGLYPSSQTIATTQKG